MARHLDQGQAAEEQALAYLHKQGLRLLARNYRSRSGEIDLVMQQADTLVFVEVRYRQSSHFGSAVESVTAAKQRKLLSTASRFLQERALDVPCRFDVVGISGRQSTEIEWIQDAFQGH
jgi:putative endonuclease